MAGGCRGAEDERYVQQLQKKVDSLDLSSSVHLYVNQPYQVTLTLINSNPNPNS
jgi:hypothetical protein